MKAVIFDMDGVLIDSEPLWKIAEVKGFGKVGLDLTQTDCEETVGLRIDEVVKMWYKKAKWEGPTCEAVTIDIVHILMEEINKNGVALPGVVETLDKCKAAGLKIGLATSSFHAIIETVLEKLDIGHYFDVVQSAEFEKWGKPHPGVFLTTAEQLNVDPLECLVIEDSLNGVIAGKAARMKVIAVPELSHAPNKKLILADQIIDSLTDFNLEDARKLFDA
ncbi:hexitol phosphatase HxpB [Putridiphycobacter roseus]|uniref:Hexitol phosphatase HxpB n=1 Tax=Putridiphycobacter roseus TaxID=2219161 RepID=A0A2W1NP25_9FLAO|nr:hexitol phosphatase HxpB [Putridiphycobacter roseus]PZE16358.1 hexitol phosphatase HxpB [Putridiphycobacter roseus]